MQTSSMILSLTEYNMDVYDSPELRAVDCNSVSDYEVWVTPESYADSWCELMYDPDLEDIEYVKRWSVVDDALYNAGVRVIGDTE